MIKTQPCERSAQPVRWREAYAMMFFAVPVRVLVKVHMRTVPVDMHVFAAMWRMSGSELLA